MGLDQAHHTNELAYFQLRHRTESVSNNAPGLEKAHELCERQENRVSAAAAARQTGGEQARLQRWACTESCAVDLWLSKFDMSWNGETCHVCVALCVCVCVI